MSLLKFITPTNLESEKEKFFGSSEYHPQFEYDWDAMDIEKFFSTSPQYASFAGAALRQDTDAMTRSAQEVFAVNFPDGAWEWCEEVLSQPAPQHRENPPIETIVEAFNRAFEVLHLEDYSVKVVDEPGFNMRPRYRTKKMILSKHASLRFFSLESLVRHEICHVIRYENSVITELTETKYLPTEEGMASYVQDLWGGGDFGALYQHACEYGVTAVGLRGSLREMIEFLLSKGMPADLAWQRAARHKYGWKDTSLPGDICKPAMYFENEWHIKQLSQAEQLALLSGRIARDGDSVPAEYYGRFSLQQLNEILGFVG